MTIDHPPAAVAAAATAAPMPSERAYLRPAAITMEALKLTPGGSPTMGTAPYIDTLALFAMGPQTAAVTDTHHHLDSPDAVTGWWRLNPAMLFTKESPPVMEFPAVTCDLQTLVGNSFAPNGGPATVRQFIP